MARRYRLKDWDVGDIALNDPNAAWRDHEATQRQIQRLKFFRVHHKANLTKGDAANLLDALEPTIKELENYDAWKEAGEPNISEWHRAHRPRRFLGKAALLLIGVCAFAYFRNSDPPKKPTPNVAPLPTVAPVAPAAITPSAVTPRQLPSGTAATAAQKRAIAKFPQLGVNGSPFNRAFIERVRRYQTEKPGAFDDPEWPSAIAAEVSAELK